MAGIEMEHLSAFAAYAVDAEENGIDKDTWRLIIAPPGKPQILLSILQEAFILPQLFLAA